MDVCSADTTVRYFDLEVVLAAADESSDEDATHVDIVFGEGLGLKLLPNQLALGAVLVLSLPSFELRFGGHYD